MRFPVTILPNSPTNIRNWVQLGSSVVALVVILQISLLLTQWSWVVRQMQAEVIMHSNQVANLEGMLGREIPGMRQDAKNILNDVVRLTGTRTLQALNLTAGTVSIASQHLEQIERIAGVQLGAVQTQLTSTNDILDDTRKDLNRQLTTFNSQVTRIADVSDPIKGIAQDFRKQFMTCPGNPGCLYSRYLALSGETIKAMDNFRLFTNDAHEFSYRFVHPNKKQILLDTLKSGVALGSKFIP